MKLLLVLALLLTMGAGLGSAPDASDLTGRLREALNAERDEHGLAHLDAAPELREDGMQWASEIAASRTLVHRTNDQLAGGAPTGWRTVGENLARTNEARAGEATRAIIGAFMRSPAHRANVLGDFDRVDVAALPGDDGLVYVVVTFVA